MGYYLGVPSWRLGGDEAPSAKLSGFWKFLRCGVKYCEFFKTNFFYYQLLLLFLVSVVHSVCHFILNFWFQLCNFCLVQIGYWDYIWQLSKLCGDDWNFEERSQAMQVLHARPFSRGSRVSAALRWWVNYLVLWRFFSLANLLNSQHFIINIIFILVVLFIITLFLCLVYGIVCLFKYFIYKY